MRRLLTAAALSMSCLVISSCGQPKVLYKPIPIPAERIDCVYTGVRPTLPPEHVIDWARLKTLAEARAEHDLYVKSVRAREAVVARYIVSVEGLAFAYSNDAEWIRNYQAELEKETK